MKEHTDDKTTKAEQNEPKDQRLAINAGNKYISISRGGSCKFIVKRDSIALVIRDERGVVFGVSNEGDVYTTRVITRSQEEADYVMDEMYRIVVDE